MNFEHNKVSKIKSKLYQSIDQEAFQKFSKNPVKEIMQNRSEIPEKSFLGFFHIETEILQEYC